MKKLQRIIICTLCFLLLTACGNTKSLPSDLSAKEIADAIVQQEGNSPTANTYYLKDGNALNAYTMSLWVDGAYQECTEFDLLDDYAVFYSADNSTYEVAVLKAKVQDDVSKLTEVLDRRKQTLSQGDKAEYDPNFDKLMSDSKVITSGNFVILLITPSNDVAIEAIDALKQ